MSTQIVSSAAFTAAMSKNVWIYYQKLINMFQNLHIFKNELDKKSLYNSWRDKICIMYLLLGIQLNKALFFSVRESLPQLQLVLNWVQLLGV